MRFTEAEYAAYQRRLQDRNPDTLFEPTERDFLAQVCTLAKKQGWLVYHTHDSRGSEAGFPDCVFVLPPSRGRPAGRLVFAELKVRTGQLSAAQQQWISVLQTVQQVECYVWRPADWQDIQGVLL